MNDTKELIRALWTKTADMVRRKKKTVTIAIAALVLIVGSMTLNGMKTEQNHAAHEEETGVHADEHDGHADEHSDHRDEDGDHGELSIVKLSEEAQKASGIEVREAVLEPLTAPIEATAVIELNADRVAKISARTSGRLVKIVASQGDVVKTGQALAWFDSPELGLAWAEYAKAKGRTGFARKNLQREETLFEKKISPEKDVMRARQELAEAEADFAFANEKFHLLGIDIAQFEKNHEGDQHPLVAVSSPIRGSVIERAATQGEVVSPDKTLFTVADLSKLWVIIDIYEKDLRRVLPGMAVKVTTTAYPDRSFPGVISFIDDVMDEKSRLIKARVVVENSNRMLKPGMFAAVTIEVKGMQTEKAIMMPEEAVFLDGAQNYVFIRTAPEEFEMREITVGRTLGSRLEVIRGLKKGESVAVKGAFILKSELKKGELVDEHGHGE
jgi:cobalt-zinc-cadmium efflux system membrane fusion protein